MLPAILEALASEEEPAAPVTVREAPPVPVITPTVPTVDPCGWFLMDWASDAIAAHYGLSADDVWAVVLDHEAKCDAGPCFGRLFERPWGFAALGKMVALKLLGVDACDALPPFMPTTH